MSKMIQIRKDYGEPFVDVVRGFAEMGYSRSMTAATLGINLPYFRQLCTRFDLHRHFRPQNEMRQECKGGGKGWPKGTPRPRAPKYKDTDLLAEVRKYPVSTLFSTMSDIHLTTVQRRFGSFRQAVRLSRESR